MFACKHLTKEYGMKVALKDVSLRLDPKEMLCIIGNSGSGKTTLWRLLTAQELPTRGSIEVDGVDLATLPPDILRLYRSRLGVIPQETFLDDRLTIAENIALPLNVLGAATHVITRNVGDLLKRFGLASKTTSFPSFLTPAERRLVVISRALVTAPVILFADELFADLDEHQRLTVTTLLTNMRKKGTSIIAFLRDTALAAELSPTNVLTMDSGSLEAHIPSRSQTGMEEPANEAPRVLQQEEPSTFTLPTTEEQTSAPRERGTLHKRKIPITAVGSL